MLGIDRIGPLQSPAIDVAQERGVLVVGAEILDDAEEIADAIVGEARLVAVLGQLAQSVVNDDRLAATVNDAVIAEEGEAAAAVEGGGHLQLDVMREGLDLVPGAAVGVERTHVQLGEVGHEDVVEVQQQRLMMGVDGLDVQGQEHRIVVGGLDGMCGGRVRLGAEADIAANQMHFVADALEDQHPLIVEVERVAAHAGAAGDGDRAEELLAELIGPNLGVQVFVFVEQPEQTVVLLGPLDQLVEVAEFLGRIIVRMLCRRGGVAEQAERHGQQRQHNQHGAFHGFSSKNDGGFRQRRCSGQSSRHSSTFSSNGKLNLTSPVDPNKTGHSVGENVSRAHPVQTGGPAKLDTAYWRETAISGDEEERTSRLGGQSRHVP